MSCFSWGAALALVPHYGVTWFSHIPQPWAATLEVKLSTLSIGQLGPGLAVGGEVEVDLEVPCSV